MTTQEILAANITKTAKMIQLFEAGHTRTQVAALLGVGYGFVQNVWARYYRQQPVTVAEIGSWSFGRKFGVEIEAYGVSSIDLANALIAAGIPTAVEHYNHTTRNHWKITSDASINGSQAFELVSPPMTGSNGIEQVNTVCRILKELGAKVNKSCGLHIHFDASNFTLADWKRIYINYASYELEIDKIVAPSRRASANGFCRSMRTTNFRTKIEAAGSLEQIEQAITSRNRYFKLNTQSFWRHRTVEFRQHNGTIEAVKITGWIKMLAQLLDAPTAGHSASWEEFTGILQPEQQAQMNARKARFERASR